MSFEQDCQERLRDAAAAATALVIQGGSSKAFYGRAVTGQKISIRDHQGILDYSPTELLVSVRAGTPLREVEALLATENQMLPFEPPHFGNPATLGGTIACGFSGPRRPYTGAARDFVLGIRCLNGQGEILRFGGKVMKNVAGYDVSRTLTGSLGTLAILLEINLRVMPRPETEVTLRQEASQEQALQLFSQWSGLPLPVSGGCCYDGQLYVRLSGMRQGVKAAAGEIGGEKLAEAQTPWQALREQQLSFFTAHGPLWRLSVPPATPPLALDGDCLLDWGGAQRWVKTDQPAAIMHALAAQAGGHATLFSGGDRSDAVFQPLPPAMLALHRRLKHSFDPAGILNPGRMYPEL